MTAISSSFERPVLMSVSTPRWRKMSTAAGLRLSAMSTRGMGRIPCGKSSRPGREDRVGLWDGPPSGGFEFGDDGGEGPVEPGGQCVDVGGVDGCAAPDPQARRGVAVAADVQRHAFLLE